MLVRLWHRALAPDQGFRLLAVEDLPLLPSLGRLLALRAPVAFLDLWLTYLGFVRMYQAVIGMQGPVWDLLLPRLPLDVSAEELRYLLQDFPSLPSTATVLPWLLLAAPLYVISLWVHDAAWDHGCLWLLGGLKAKRGFSTTLIAESEALQVGVFGALLALTTNLPTVGWLFSLPMGIVGLYFWILRGFALAAFHRCPLWKGIVATVLHAGLVILFVLGALLLLLLLLAQGIA
jgi:hypothetical protein